LTDYCKLSLLKKYIHISKATFARYADFFKPRYCLSLRSGSAYAKSRDVLVQAQQVAQNFEIDSAALRLSLRKVRRWTTEPLHPAFCTFVGVVGQ